MTSFVTFTSHSHLPKHTPTLLHTQTYKPQTLTPSAAENPSVAEDSHPRPLTQLSMWTHSHFPSHPNIQTPNPHSIGNRRLSSAASYLALSLSHSTEVNFLVLGLRLSFETLMDSKLEILGEKKKKHRADIVFLSIEVQRSKTQKYFSFFLILNYFVAWETRFL